MELMMSSGGLALLAAQPQLPKLDTFGVMNTNHSPSSSSSSGGSQSLNITECVPVSSSEHVAEIVGRQGEPLITYYNRYILFYEILKFDILSIHITFFYEIFVIILSI